MTRKNFAAISAFFMTLLIASVAFAADEEAAHSILTGAGSTALLAGGLTIALAAFGGALAQGRAAAAALEGIARNPGAAGKLFTPMILGLALIESLVIYALIIAFQIVGKVG